MSFYCRPSRRRLQSRVVDRTQLRDHVRVEARGGRDHLGNAPGVQDRVRGPDADAAVQGCDGSKDFLDSWERHDVFGGLDLLSAPSDQGVAPLARHAASICPFLDEWGSGVAQLEESQEVLAALVIGSQKVQGQQGYYRAIAGMLAASSGAFEARPPGCPMALSACCEAPKCASSWTCRAYPSNL
jgi:hypothetical protein